MSNIIVSNSFRNVADADITARSQATGYGKVNVMDRWNLKRRFRADDITANNYLLKFYHTTPQTFVGVFLNDVNFDAVQLQGNGADSWTVPDYAGTEIEVFQNKITGRSQVYIPISGFSNAYSRIFISSGAGPVGSYQTKWEIGTVCFLTAITELSRDMGYEYGQTARHFFKTSVNERVKLGEEIRWEGSLVFGNRELDEEDELWTLNQIDMSLPFLFYENKGDTAAAYLCVRDDSIEIKRISYNAVAGNTIKIKEAYMIGEN